MRAKLVKPATRNGSDQWNIRKGLPIKSKFNSPRTRTKQFIVPTRFILMNQRAELGSSGKYQSTLLPIMHTLQKGCCNNKLEARGAYSKVFCQERVR